MKKRLYPAVLERGSKGTFGAWFVDFPGCVAGGKSQEQAIERIALPRGCDFVAYFIVGVDPPDPSERVNVYLPKSLIGQIDRRAAELGMSRSSFFGLAASTALVRFPGFREDLPAPRSKVHKTGGLRTGKRLAKKP